MEPFGAYNNWYRTDSFPQFQFGDKSLVAQNDGCNCAFGAVINPIAAVRHFSRPKGHNKFWKELMAVHEFQQAGDVTEHVMTLPDDFSLTKFWDKVLKRKQLMGLKRTDILSNLWKEYIRAVDGVGALLYSKIILNHMGPEGGVDEKMEAYRELKEKCT